MIWVGRLMSFAVVLQTIEFFWVRFYPSEIVAAEFPAWLRWTLCRERWILTLRLLAAISALTWPTIAGVGVMLLTTWWLAVRWRGTFNGGSDFMTFHILAAWLLCLCFPSLERVSVGYVVIQLILAYFVAGMAKVANSSWRSGAAPRIFLQRRGIEIGGSLCLLMAWSIISFEMLFPLSILRPWPFVAAGVLFHLANVYTFGLNRFFFAWLAAYPALFYLAR